MPLPGEWLCGFRWIPEVDSYLECELALGHEGDHHRHEAAMWPNLASRERRQFELDHAEKYGARHA
jgi:hypothetical protein